MDAIGAEVASLDAIGKDLRADFAGNRRQLRTKWIFDIYNRNAWRGHQAAVEKFSLRRKVVLHRAVKIEVVASEVGKDGHIKGQAVNTALGEGVRGDFHYCLGGSGVRAIAKELEQIARLGGSVGRIASCAHHVILDGADQNGLAACVIQHRVEQEGGCGFAVCSSHATQGELLFRMCEEIRCDRRESAAAVRNFGHGNMWMVERQVVEGRR